LQRAPEKSEGAGKRMWNEKMAIRDHLKPVGVIHRIVGYEKDFRSDEDKKCRETERDPENSFES
jgi:hypothetical protein